MWNSEDEEANRFVRIIRIPEEARTKSVFIEVPKGTTFRQEVKWHGDYPAIFASVPNDSRDMIKLRLTTYRIEEVPMGRDICGPMCLGTFYGHLGVLDLHVAFLDANIAE